MPLLKASPVCDGTSGCSDHSDGIPKRAYHSSMRARLGIWAIDDGKPERVERSSVDLEVDLESWIENNPELLAEDLTVVGRQLHVEGGFIDLLAVDAQGRWVVIELKRDRLRRDVVTQAIDYASSIRSMETADLVDLIRAGASRLAQPDTADEVINEILEADAGTEREVVIIVAGAGVDSGLERLVDYLAAYDVPVRVVSFEVYEMPSGQRLLAREVIDEDRPSARTVSASRYRTVEQIAELGGSPENIDAFSRIVAAAESAGLALRPYINTLMIAPPQQRHRYLMALSPQPGRGLKISHGPDAFEEFFPALSASSVEDVLGPRGAKLYSGEELRERVTLIEGFFAELPSVGGGDGDAKADTPTVVSIASLLEPGEWTTYGDISAAATGRSSAAMAVGAIARNNPDFPNAHRVLNLRGVPPTGWRSDTGGGPDECRERLAAEGIRFLAGGFADPSQRVDASELSRRRASHSPTH